MHILSNERLEEIKRCSGDLWGAFKMICSKDVGNKEEFLQYAFAVFKEKYEKYKNTPVCSYVVQYSHDLINEIERLLYPGKVKKSNFQNISYMNYGEFCEYLKDPNPGDMITVVRDGENLARIKVRTVINT